MQYLVAIIIILIVVLIWTYSINGGLRPYKWSRNEIIYLDNNATVPPYPDVLQAYTLSSYFGNASASYATDARAVIDMGNKVLLDWVDGQKNKKEVIWTSGASESNCLFLRGVVDTYWKSRPLISDKLHATTDMLKRLSVSDEVPHIITTSVEHKVTLLCIEEMVALREVEVTKIDPRPDGSIDPMEIAYAIRPSTIAVSIISVGNETSAVNDLKTISTIIDRTTHDDREMQMPHQRIYLHVDCVQSFGKMPPRIPRIDALSVSFHKLAGPVGVGALIVSPECAQVLKKGSQIPGSQNYGVRGGTENVAGIAGAMIASAITFNDRDSKNNALLQMKNYLISGLQAHYRVGNYLDYYDKPDTMTFPISTVHPSGSGEVVFLGPVLKNGLPDPTRSALNTLYISFVKYGALNDHFCNLLLKHQLQRHGAIISVGSACNTADPHPSHVLTALKAPYIIRCGIVRISLGDQNTMGECQRFLSLLTTLVDMQFKN